VRVGETLGHRLRLPEGGLQIVLYVDHRAGDSHATVAEVGDRAQHHEGVRVHVDVDAPFLRLFGKPAGVAQPVVRQVVGLACGLILRGLLGKLVRRSDARFGKADFNLLYDFFPERRLEDAGRIDPFVETHQKAGVDVLLRPRERLEKGLRKIPKQLHLLDLKVLD
jgi:hypothetical protein